MAQGTESSEEHRVPPWGQAAWVKDSRGQRSPKKGEKADMAPGSPGALEREWSPREQQLWVGPKGFLWSHQVGRRVTRSEGQQENRRASRCRRNPFPWYGCPLDLVLLTGATGNKIPLFS